MDERQEREFYEQQRQLPNRNPTYTPIWSSALGSSKSKYAKWFARTILILMWGWIPLLLIIALFHNFPIWTLFGSTIFLVWIIQKRFFKRKD